MLPYPQAWNIVLKLEFISDHLTPYLAMTVPCVVGGICELCRSVRVIYADACGEFLNLCSRTNSTKKLLTLVGTRKYPEGAQQTPSPPSHVKAVSPGTG